MLKQDKEMARMVNQEMLILGIAEDICAFLNQHGITQSQLADRLGKSKGFVSQLLSGESNLTLRTLADLCWALDVKPEFSLRPGNWQTHDTDRSREVGGNLRLVRARKIKKLEEANWISEEPLASCFRLAANG